LISGGLAPSALPVPVEFEELRILCVPGPGPLENLAQEEKAGENIIKQNAGII